jgi:DNA-binding response OmpR family regulator
MAYKLVVADSSPSVQRVVQMAFSGPDFEVYLLEDGQQVLESIGRINPDAVLLSLALPSKDGYEISHYLRSREDFKKTVLFLLKNAFEPLDAEKMNRLDYDGMVQKPFDSEELARLVRDVIDKKRGPHSLPEESLLEENPAAATLPLFEEPSFHPPSSASRSEDELEEKIKQVMREEILAVERELEKRLKASLRTELKDWLDKEPKKSP